MLYSKDYFVHSNILFSILLVVSKLIPHFIKIVNHTTTSIAIAAALHVLLLLLLLLQMLTLPCILYSVEYSLDYIYVNRSEKN